MKFKYFVWMMLVLAVGGFVTYKIIRNKDGKSNDFVSEKDDDNLSFNKNETNEKFNVDVFENEKQCDETMYRTYENMNVRNEQAKQILFDIHNNIKKSEENIEFQKEEIAKIMENLKK